MGCYHNQVIKMDSKCSINIFFSLNFVFVFINYRAKRLHVSDVHFRGLGILPLPFPLSIGKDMFMCVDCDFKCSAKWGQKQEVDVRL